MALRGLLLAAAAAAAAASDCAPGMRWVNYGSSPTSMVISYTTACEASAFVAYGTTPSALTQTASGPAPTTYSTKSYTSPYIYHVTLTGLAPNTQYYYAVGDKTSGASAVASFTSHPGVGPGALPDGGLVFAVIGDLGQTANSNDTVQHIRASRQVTSVIHVGDLSYADDDKNEAEWDSWQRLVDPLSSSTPWMTIDGNHEIENYGGTPFLSYTTRFAAAMPTPASAPAGSLFYSFDIGMAHWVMASTYSPFAPGSDQYNFVASDLAAVDRSVTPWVFFGTHAPWYNSNMAHQGDGEAMRKAIEPLLYNASVDAAFFGHVHAYERNQRVHNFAADPNGPYYITIGDGGNREGLASIWLSQPPYSAFRKASYGHGELQVVNATHAYWSWHENPDSEPTIADELWIVKGQ